MNNYLLNNNFFDINLDNFNINRVISDIPILSPSDNGVQSCSSKYEAILKF